MHKRSAPKWNKWFNNTLTHSIFINNGIFILLKLCFLLSNITTVIKKIQSQMSKMLFFQMFWTWLRIPPHRFQRQIGGHHRFPWPIPWHSPIRAHSLRICRFHVCHRKRQRCGGCLLDVNSRGLWRSYWRFSTDFAHNSEQILLVGTNVEENNQRVQRTVQRA